MKIFKQGAEAIIYFEKVDGRKVLVKERIQKKYRLEEIDRRLRLERTRQEVKLMREARGHGVATPRIILSDGGSYKILMEHIDGKTLKEVLSKRVGVRSICRKVGESVGRMHSAGIVHGDLTTSNMILKGGKIYFIDFGLGHFSKRTEDMATDLSVAFESIDAMHSDVSPECKRAIESGYRSENARHNEVLSRVKEIESRSRYADRKSTGVQRV